MLVMIKSTALLVIDMQVCGFDGKIRPPIEKGAILLQDVAALIGAARHAGMPVIHIQHCGQQGKPFSRGMHGWDIHAQVSPQSGEVVVQKPQSSAFIGTILEKILTEKGISTLITCGIQSEYCVSNTSISALELGFRVCVAGDAHGTVSTDDDAAVIVSRQNALLADRGARVLTNASLLSLIASN